MMIAGTVFPLLASRTSWKLYFLTTFILISVVTTFAICIPNIMEIFGVIGKSLDVIIIILDIYIVYISTMK